MITQMHSKDIVNQHIALAMALFSFKKLDKLLSPYALAESIPTIASPLLHFVDINFVKNCNVVLVQL